MEGPDREVKVNLNKEGVQEEVTLMYRSAPCNSTHSQKVVKSTAGAGPCPVEFGYLYSKNYHRQFDGFYIYRLCTSPKGTNIKHSQSSNSCSSKNVL